VNAHHVATETVIVAMELVIEVRGGAVLLVKSQLAPTTATIMENALMESATAELDLLEKTAQSEHALPIVTVTESV